MENKKVDQEAGKKALAKLAKVKAEAEHLDQQVELQEKLGHRVYSQAEVDELFVLDKEQCLPFLRGKERKPGGDLIALAKCERKRGRPDYFYLYRKGRDVSRLQRRYSAVKPREKEALKEMREQADQAAEKRSFRTNEDRYQPAGKKLTKKDVLKKRYGR